MGKRKSTGIYERRNDDGSTSFVAQVRIKPFKPTSRTFDTKADAIAWRAEMEGTLRAERKGSAVRQDLPSLTIGKLILEYHADPETAALRTIEDKQLLGCWWIQHYGTVKVLDFSVIVLREARQKLLAGRANGTVNRYLSEMRSAWNWGRASGLIPKNEVWPQRLMLTEPKARTRFLEDDELVATLAAARKHSLLMYVAIVVSICCGLRQSELLRLDWADLDLTGKHSTTGPRLLVRESKNEDARAVHIPEIAVEALQELKGAKVVAPHVFIGPKGGRLKKTTLRTWWKAIRSKAGLQDFRWHDQRHTAASFLAQHGSNLLEIGATLGHRSPSATAKYAHLVAGAPTRGHAGLNEKVRGAR